MIVTPEQLRQILPQAGSRAFTFCGPINQAMAEFVIESARQAASFIAQVGHESRQLQACEENLNYSAEALVRIWPKRFDAAVAARCARHPELIANRAYANRYGNGDEDSGDGWRYRGRGLIQITFRDNYASCGAALDLDLVGQPELLLDPANAARSAGWFWKDHGLNAAADAGDVALQTRLINGGTLGLAERQALVDRALEVLT